MTGEVRSRSLRIVLNNDLLLLLSAVFLVLPWAVYDILYYHFFFECLRDTE